MGDPVPSFVIRKAVVHTTNVDCISVIKLIVQIATKTNSFPVDDIVPEFNIVIPRNPKAIKAIILRLNSLLKLNLDIADLDHEAEELEVKLNFMASHNQEFQAYVEELEKEYAEVKYEAPLDITANEAVHLAEEFLKERREE